MTDMTEDQKHILEQEQKQHPALYTEENWIMDKETGELVDASKRQIRKETKEPDYVKIYYKTWLAFIDTDKLPLKFLMALSGYIRYANDPDDCKDNGRVDLTRAVKHELCEAMGVGMSSLTKYLREAVKCGVLIRYKNYRDSYIANPHFIARGRWNNIQSFMSTINWVDGEWINNIEEE